MTASGRWAGVREELLCGRPASLQESDPEESAIRRIHGDGILEGGGTKIARGMDGEDHGRSPLPVGEIRRTLDKIPGSGRQRLCLIKGQSQVLPTFIGHQMLILLRRELERKNGIREETLEQLIQRQTQARALGRSVAALQSSCRWRSNGPRSSFAPCPLESFSECAEPGRWRY